MHIPRDEADVAGQGAAPIDLSHLSRQTLGDVELEREVLQLFIHQMLSIDGEFAQADSHERARLAHALVGASRGVGAFALAEAASKLEQAPYSAQAISEVKSLIEDVKSFASARLE